MGAYIPLSEKGVTNMEKEKTRISLVVLDGSFSVNSWFSI